MKNLILVSIIVLLTACSITTEDSAKGTDDIKVISDHPDTTSGVGEICGGVDKITCHQGLSCIFDYDTADGHGLCAEKIVNEKECENVYDPVCGLNDSRQKYVYFNKCQMERHGAELVNEGKCNLDETVAGNCEAEARGFSNCFGTTVGYEFDGDNCVKKVVAGCDYEIPFTSQEACEAKCS